MRSVLRALLPESVVVRHLALRDRKGILLTFDDGPHPDVTPAVLDRLDAFAARAVFFLIGSRIERAPHLLRQITERGHLIGNHTYHHRDADVVGDRRPHFGMFYHDARRCQVTVEQYTGRRPRFFRPPGGRLTPVTVLVPKLLGLHCVTWSADVGDWRFRSVGEAQAGAERLMRSIKGGDIVLLHDDNPYVLDLLDALLPRLRADRWDLASGIDALDGAGD